MIRTMGTAGLGPGTPRSSDFPQKVTLRNLLRVGADQFHCITTTLKARHEIAMNAIRNLK